MTAVVLAVTPEGHHAAMVLANPPTADDIARLAMLGSMPGLAHATWTATEGDSPR